MAFQTLPANDRMSGPYVAGLGQTVLGFDFPAYNEGEIVVTRSRAGSLTYLVINVDFTITINNDGSGGIVTLNVGAKAGDVITIAGDTSTGRETAFDPRGDFTSTEVNRQLNRLHMLAQESARDLASTVRLPLGQAVPPLPLGDGFLQKIGGMFQLVAGLGIADAVNVLVSALGAAISGISLNTLLSRTYDARRFGAKLDARTAFDAAMVNGSDLVNSPITGFTAGDVGKICIVQGAVPNGPPVNASRRPLVANIIEVISATQAKLSLIASKTVAGAEIIVGTNDTVAIQNAINTLGMKGGDLTLPGHAIVTGLTFTGQNCRLRGTGPCRFSLDETAWGAFLPPVLADVPSRLIYAGPDLGTLLLHDIGEVGGVWRKLAGNGLRDLVLDGAGRAARCVRTLTAPQYRYEKSVLTRATDVHFLVQVTSNEAARNQWLNVAARDGRMMDCDIYNRCTNIFGSKTFVIAGDKGDDWGNLNYHWFHDSSFIVEDDGTLQAHHVEQADNIYFVNCNWNARLVLHSADSGSYSTFRGYLPGAQLLDASAPSTRSITMRGGRFRLSVVGTGSVAVTAGTATIAGGGAASAGSPRDFEITGPTGAGGTITLTITGSVTAWTLTARHWASQARTVQVSGGAGLVQLIWSQGLGVGGASGAGFHPTNVKIGHVSENINTLPLIIRPGTALATDPGPDAFVFNDSGTVDQTPGSFAYGSNPAGVLLSLGVAQNIPTGVWTAITWPAPVAADDQLGAFSAGAPAIITVPPNVRAMRVRAVAQWAANGAGGRGLALSRNGVRLEPTVRPANVGGDITDNAVEFSRIGVIPGQQWSVEAVQGSGGPLALQPGTTRLEVTYF